MKLPHVHIAVNIGGLAVAVGSTLLQLVISNPAPVIGLFPEKDALAVATVIGAIASFLPTKRQTQTTGAVSENTTAPKS